MNELSQLINQSIKQLINQSMSRSFTQSINHTVLLHILFVTYPSHPGGPDIISYWLIHWFIIYITFPFLPGGPLMIVTITLLVDLLAFEDPWELWVFSSLIKLTTTVDLYPLKSLGPGRLLATFLCLSLPSNNKTSVI